MVSLTVIRITPAEAAALAATESWSSAEADSIINSAVTEQINTDTECDRKLCNRPSCTKRAQHPSPLCWIHGAKDSICSYTGCSNKGILHGLCPDHGGLVQLCRQRGCINVVDFEKRGGLCYIHQTGEDSSDDDSDDDEEIRLCSFKGCINGATTDEGICDMHSTYHNNESREEKKRTLPSDDSISNKETKKSRKADAFMLDLSDVPPQPTIPKSKGRIKEGASKYTGVSFDKSINKWIARIKVEGKPRFIGDYENEEEAATDYARAVFKYKGQGNLGKAKKKRKRAPIDLSGVPQQKPIPKHGGHKKDGASSKYTGVHLEKSTNKWTSQITIKGKQRFIGSYEKEEEAAADYARALLKYKGQGELDKAMEKSMSRGQNTLVIDLSGVPSQKPIPKMKGQIKEGASKYAGVSFVKGANQWKWRAIIRIDGMSRCVGTYDTEEEAASDYARAFFKYRGGQEALHKERIRTSGQTRIDLSDVPPQPLILSRRRGFKNENGASKYTGTCFYKAINKWQAQIHIEGKQRIIGYYENEEAAAADYARAVFKYKKQKDDK